MGLPEHLGDVLVGEGGDGLGDLLAQLVATGGEGLEVLVALDADVEVGLQRGVLLRDGVILRDEPFVGVEQ